MPEIRRLKPVNRHLLIVPHLEENKTESAVLLPEDYNPQQDAYVVATVVDIAPDCSEQLKHLKYGNIQEKRIVVERAMVQKIKIKEHVSHIILENYVVAVYRGPNEN